MRKGLVVGVITVASFAGTACDENLRDLTGPTPDLTPTFASIQRDIFQTTDAAGRSSCVTCHTDARGVPPAGLVLRDGVAYGALVNAPSRFKAGAVLVVPGDPENSYLIHKLEGRSGIVGLRMPRNGPPFLTDGQLLVIRRWIELGAPNN